MADSKISALSELAATPASADELVLVDKDDTTMAASGTNKRVKFSNVVPTINVKAYGAAGDGIQDDTSAINAAITAAQALTAPTLYFPPGIYKITSALTSFTGSQWSIFGHGSASVVWGTHLGPVFTIDASSASAWYGQFSDLEIRGPATGSFAGTYGILGYASTGSVTGVRHWTFRNLRFRELERGIQFNETGKDEWPVGSGIFQIGAHCFNHFENIRCQGYGSREMTYGIRFVGMLGADNQVLGGNFLVSAAGTGFSAGSGGADQAVGDFTMVGCHIMQAGIGVDLLGPTGANRYNENVTLLGNQFDNCATATVRADHMQNCRFGPNNLTNSADISLTNCTNIFYVDHNKFAFPNGVAVGGATLSTTTGLATAAGTTGVSSLRIPHGAAPTSPVNGDIWTTTAGLFVRVNGSTVGPLS